MIASTKTKVIYLGNGATKEFPITFGYADPATVKAGIYDPATDQTTELTKDYYVDTVRNSVFYPGYAPGQAPPESEQPGPLPAPKKLVVYRVTPMDQTIDLGTKYPLPIIEKIGDKNTLIEQELAEKLGRAVLADIGSGKTVEDIQREIREDRLAAEKAANEAQEAKATSENNADLAQAWAEAPHSPNGVDGSKSAKMWAKEAQENGAVEAEKAKHWADEAKTSEAVAQTSAAEARGTATEVGRILTDVNHAALYDSNRTYAPGECAMVENGDVYRCTQESRGENPVTSPKWVSVATTIFHTFELDGKGDLMPRQFPQPSTLWSVDANGDIMAADI